MKSVVMLSLICSSVVCISSNSFAAQKYCGKIENGSPGYALKLDDGGKYQIDSVNADVNDEVGQLEGQRVCVDADLSGNTIVVQRVLDDSSD